MKSKTLLCMVFGLSLGLALSGCSFIVSPVVPPIGTAVNVTTFPVDIEYGPNDIGPTVGKSKTQSILGLVAWGDCSVETAAKNANIQQIDHVDARYFNILGVYMEYETSVWGKTAEQLETPTTGVPADSNGLETADASSMN